VYGIVVSVRGTNLHSPGSVDEYDVKAILGSVLDSIKGNTGRILVVALF
jgi:hypothetical protein